MLRTVAVLLATVPGPSSAVPPAPEPRSEPPGQEFLQQVEDRGRLIARLASAERTAAAAVPAEVRAEPLRLAYEAADGIHCAFGTLDRARHEFRVRCDIVRTAGGSTCAGPPTVVAAGPLRAAAEAVAAARDVFPMDAGAAYADVVVPEADGTLSVYLFPSLAKPNHVVEGADGVVHVSPKDGSTVIERYHTGLRTMDPTEGLGEAQVGHVHEADDVPNPMDVAYVLLREPTGAPAHVLARTWKYYIDKTGHLSIMGRQAPLRDTEQAGTRLPGVLEQRPRWATRLVLWPDRPPERSVWRYDARLAGKFETGYPDDIQVIFASDVPAKNRSPEIMWVTILDYDKATDVFLGHVINEPFHLETVGLQDNVVFRWDPSLASLVALRENGSYRAAARPATECPEFLDTVLEAARTYRKSPFGHDKAVTERCLAILRPAVKAIPAKARPDERFAAHFLLARCLAESYVTGEAIEEFKAAIAADPGDRDAQMGLLAEYSVLVHSGSGAERAAAEKAFLAQRELVTRQFAADPAVAGFEAPFDPAKAGDTSKLSPAEIEHGRRFGFGPFRWKFR